MTQDTRPPLAPAPAGDTALHIAAREGHLTVCELLVAETKLQLEDKNGAGRTPVEESPPAMASQLRELHTETLLERYKIKRGAGSRARCIDAHDTKEGRRVMLKFVEDRASAEYEHRMLSSLDANVRPLHPRPPPAPPSPHWPRRPSSH